MCICAIKFIVRQTPNRKYTFSSVLSKKKEEDRFPQWEIYSLANIHIYPAKKKKKSTAYDICRSHSNAQAIIPSATVSLLSMRL